MKKPDLLEDIVAFNWCQPLDSSAQSTPLCPHCNKPMDFDKMEMLWVCVRCS